MNKRQHKLIITLISAIVLSAAALVGPLLTQQQPQAPAAQVQPGDVLAREGLMQLPVKGRAPTTGYSREQFSDGWAKVNGCDIRNIILARDMVDVIKDADNCTVISGTLYDNYTNKTIKFIRGAQTSDDVQIDHIVAVSDAWQKGAQQLPKERREMFYNDPLNLMAVDGPTNTQKGNADAATWLPPNKAYRCRYIARQIALKRTYGLWVTHAEQQAMQQVIASCPNQVLPRSQ